MKHVFDAHLDHCLCCGSQNIRDYKKDYRDVMIVRCGDCGFQFMNPQFEDNYIHQYYILLPNLLLMSF